MKKASIIWTLMIIFLASFVLATDSNFVPVSVAPEAYSTSTSTAVLFNMTANWTGSTIVQANQVNCSLFAKNTSAGTYTNYTPYRLITNTSTTYGYRNETVTLNNNNRYWSYWSCKNNATSAVELGNTSVLIIDVDTTYDVLSFGNGKVANISMSTGAFTTIGTITAPVLRLTNSSSTGTAVEGTIFFNTTSKKFVGWNSTEWTILG